MSDNNMWQNETTDEFGFVELNIDSPSPENPNPPHQDESGDTGSQTDYHDDEVREELYRDYPQIKDVINQMCDAYPDFFIEDNLEVEKLGYREYSVNWKYEGEYTRNAIEVRLESDNEFQEIYGSDHYIFAYGGYLEGENDYLNYFLNFPANDEVYIVDGNFLFRTDYCGRTNWAWANVSRALKEGHKIDRDRSRDFSDWVSANGYSEDVAGHIISDKFNGPTELINVVPMNVTLAGGNSNKYIRNALNAANGNKNNVETTVVLSYEGTCRRPYLLDAYTSINGVETKKSYQNVFPQQEPYSDNEDASECAGHENVPLHLSELYRDYPQIKDVINQICEAYPSFYELDNIEVIKTGYREYSVKWKHDGEYTNTAMDIRLESGSDFKESYGTDHCIYAYGGYLEDGNDYMNDFLNFVMANEVYIVDDKFLFQTDDYGRTSRAWANVSSALNGEGKDDRDRSGDFSAWVSENGLASDVAGHIISDKFYGPTELINVVPMNPALAGGNSNKYIKHALYSNDGYNEVTTWVYLLYKGASMRPYKLQTYTFINGKQVAEKIYQNKP